MTKSFSPAGMAVKAYFGRGARTFGNPGGATSGNGSFNGGGGAPGFVWTQRSVASLFGVAYGGSQGWAAVGNNEFWHSADGITWALAQTATPTTQLFSVTKGGASVFAALGIDPAAAPQVVAYTSADGVLWTQRTVTAIANQSPVGVAFGNARFLSDDTLSCLISGDNGLNWIDGTAFPTSSGFGYIYFDGLNFLCLVSDNSGCPGPPAVALTADGNTFVSTICTELTPFASPVAVVKGGLLYALVDSLGEISTSPSSTWNGTLRASTGLPLQGIAYGAGQFVATSQDGNVATSSDGITWITSASGSSSFGRIDFGTTFFVAVGPGGIWTFGP